MNRYATLVKWYDDLASKLADARKRVEAGKSLPTGIDLVLTPGK